MTQPKAVKTSLPKIVSRGSKRVGRGYSSGKGAHTVGRGQKGQKSRSNRGLKLLFEGLKAKKSLIRKTPQLRGKLKNKPFPKPITLSLTSLNKIPAGTKVDIEAVVKYGLVDKRKANIYGVKVLNVGKLDKKLEILLPMSTSAVKKFKSKAKAVKKK